MTGKEFVPLAIRTEAPIDAAVIERMTKNIRGIHAYTGMLTEIGELADQFKKHLFYGKPLDLTNVHEELSDCLWYMALLFDAYGGSFEEVMDAVIRKLRSRYPNKFTEKDALNRDTDREMDAFKTTSGNYHITEDSSASEIINRQGDQIQRLVAENKQLKEQLTASTEHSKDVLLSEVGPKPHWACKNWGLPDHDYYKCATCRTSLSNAMPADK